MLGGFPKVTQLPREVSPGLRPSRVYAVHLVDRGETETGAREEPWCWAVGTDVALLSFPAAGPRLCQPSSDQQEA